MFLANLFKRRQFVDSGVINQDLDLAKAGSLERSSSHETLGLGQEESSFDCARDSHSSRRDFVGYYRAAGANAGGVLGRDRNLGRHAIHLGATLTLSVRELNESIPERYLGPQSNHCGPASAGTFLDNQFASALRRNG